MADDYSDIINLPHKQSNKRRHMTNIERAAQFGAFRALTGFEDEVLEASRLTEQKHELDEYAKEELDEKLKLLSSDLYDGTPISITFFAPDEKKSGGKYIEKTGVIKKIKRSEGIIVFDDKTKININDVIFIS